MQEKRIPLFVRWKRTKRAFRVCLGFIVVLLLGYYVAFPIYLRLRANYLARQFEQDPSQELADQLAEMLEWQAFSKKRGGEVLEKLLEPETVMRKSYAVGRPAVAKVRSKYRLSFMISNLELWATNSDHEGLLKASVPDVAKKSFSDYRNGLYLRFRPDKPGVFEETRTFEGKLDVPRNHLEFDFSSLAPGPGFVFPISLERDYDSAPLTYEWQLQIPIKFVVLPLEQAERIELRSNQELDMAMKATIKSATIEGMPFFWVFMMIPASMHIQQPTGCLYFFSQNTLPENAGFKISLESKDGVRYPIPDDSVVWQEYIFLATRPVPPFSIKPEGLKLPNGDEEGFIVLRTDVDRAYEDPEIKTLWNGELVFPITLNENGFNIPSATTE